tara:strand:+ start:1887 stop:2414 length:528 start_codon:yes stop_codon:yes gene_type:complete
MATEKFKALAHFIMHQCRDSPERLGATRLNKALWFADTYEYLKSGRSITGDEYVKRQNGPVPKHILKTVDQLKADGSIVVQEPEFEYDSRKFVSMRAPNEGVLTDAEQRTAEIAVELMCKKTTTEISDATHDIVWHAAAMGEEIPMFATLAGVEGEVTDDVLSWANQSISARDAY